ncbi:MAG: HlyD family efflux transporter periplasmic adaptor subunit [Gemmatimonadaceae bacterium]
MTTGCRATSRPDAYGNFEATEVVVSAQAAGQIEQFLPVEGATIAKGTQVALIDTTQLALQRRQIEAQNAAATARSTQATQQLAVLKVQSDVSKRAFDRAQRLHAEKAGTAQQLDQAERDYRVLMAQIAAAESQSQSVKLDAAAAKANVAQIDERISKSRVLNPTSGTVLTTYARAGEVVQSGAPLYRIANLDTMTLRAYVSEAQLTSFRVGQGVAVHVDQRGGKLLTLPGTVSWVASTSEFTPTPVQTRDERTELVYAIKVLVKNPDGALKIGMPADLSLDNSQEKPTSLPPDSSHVR